MAISTSSINYQGQILKALTEMNLDYSEGTVTPESISFQIADRQVPQKVVIEWDKRYLLLIRNVASFRLTEMARLPVAQVLVRTNWGLSNGNFEVDLSDGEIRFKASSFYREIDDIAPMFKYHMQASIETFQDVVHKLLPLNA